MINMLLAHTLEVDDKDLALRDILLQLDLPHCQKNHSVGIIHCTHPFIESGVVQAICERLPFPVLGINTLLHSSALGLVDNMLLTITVFTSDDIKFATGLSAPLEAKGNLKANIADIYVETENLMSSRPSLGLVFGPSLTYCAMGEILVEVLNEVSDGVPFFGALAADYSTYIRHPRIIYNGKTYNDRLGIILMEGKLSPRFCVYPVSDKKTIRQKAIVTDSEGNLIRKVNGMPVLEFLESLGLCWAGQISGTHTIPLFLDRNDGQPPIVRTIQSQTPDGGIILCGNAPVDTTLGFGAMDIKHILESVRRVSILMKLLNPDVFYLYSCISRNIALGLNYTAEMEAVHHDLEGLVPYLFSYSSGEICPLIQKDGRWHNEFHNMSLVTANF
ncbi:MAG: FIST C-terminal domain-containing protein [Deltaproteobacteria bacterium]|jgi:hypothetical protein|nr:FIST C-terminal domain-containing protein [Deltaproteobacteria bacterium]